MAAKDLKQILEGWPYVPGQISVRRIRGADNRIKIQMRVDLGVLQMESRGRPDGLRPHGYESLVDYQQSRIREYTRANGTDLGFTLDRNECRELREEAQQYYHRYVANFILEDYDAVVRDTERNLRTLDLCGTYAQEDSDRYALEGYRPYITMMRSQSLALMALRRGAYRTALNHVRRGMKIIRRCYRQAGQEGTFRDSSEYQVLDSLRRQIGRHLPPDRVRQLRRQLRAAVAAERYEEAAKLRDQLSALLSERRGPSDAGHSTGK